MNEKDLECLRMAKMCTFPGDLKKHLIKLGIDENLADEIAFAFGGTRNGFLSFLMDYHNFPEYRNALLIYINSFGE